MKTVRVYLGRVQEIFQASKADLVDKLHPDLLAAMLEVDDGVVVNPGDDWDGVTFSPHVKPPRPTDEDRLRIEMATPGSMIRALAILTFREVNKLRVKNGDPAYTLDQFLNALAAELP